MSALVENAVGFSGQFLSIDYEQRKNYHIFMKIEELKSVLITGGYGFIGSNFIRLLREKNPSVKIYNFDKLTYAANIENLKDFENDSNYTFIRGDIKDGSMLDIIFPKVELVVHFAAETHVDRSIHNPGEFVLTDVYGTFSLLEKMKQHKNVKLFIHISTDEVYGSIKKGSFTEDSPMNPSSPYSASKTGADRLAYSYFKTYELPIIIVRPSNNYGPYQHVEKFIPLFITNVIEERSLPLYGTGENIRDWLFVEDNCKAIMTVIEKGKTGEAYNIGASQEKKNIEVVDMILNYFNKSRDILDFVDDRRAHDFRYSLNWDKIGKLGWKPEVNFDEGLKRTIEWYINNRNWWEKVKKGEFSNFYQKNYKKELQ